MLSTLFAAITFTFMLPLGSFAEGATIQPTESLSRKNEDPKLKLTTLQLINEANNAKGMEAQSTSKPQDKAKVEMAKTDKVHKVSRGETLSGIAMKYGVSTKEIIILNEIKSENYLYLGQLIKIPASHRQTKRTINSTNKKEKEFEFYDPNNYHIVSTGETLSSIAEMHKIGLKELIKLNKINDPNTLALGAKIKLKDELSDDPLIKRNTHKKTTEDTWRNYGPLKIDWSNWRDVDGSHVAPTLYKDGEAFYLAVNCSFRKINATDPDGIWRDWISPVDNFELNLVKDLCNSKQN